MSRPTKESESLSASIAWPTGSNAMPERDHVLRRACRSIADHRRRFERWLRLLEVKCNRCGRLSKAHLKKVSALQTTPRFAA